METKKRAKKATTATKVKRAVQKAVTKPAPPPKKRATTKRKSRRIKQPNLPKPTFVKAVWGGVAANGRAFVEITTAEDFAFERLAVSVNGKSVWEGLP